MRKQSIVTGIALAVAAVTLSMTTPASAVIPVSATPFQDAQADLAVAVELEAFAAEHRQLGLTAYKQRINAARATDDQAQGKRRLAEAKLTTRDPAQLDEAKGQLNEAIELHQVADTFREQGQQSNVQQLAVADAADDQAKTFRLRARQTLQQAGFIDEARAIGLRVQGHQHRVQAEKASAQAEVDTLLASSLGARSASLHQTVLVIRATGPDADLKAVASQLDQMSRADAREARRLDSEARRLTSQARSANRLADSYYRQADRLDPGGL